MDAQATVEAFRCMACGHAFELRVVRGEDEERACPRCRSNSIRHLKGQAAPAKE